jgi:hypothetical protein
MLARLFNTTSFERPASCRTAKKTHLRTSLIQVSGPALGFSSCQLINANVRVLSEARICERRRVCAMLRRAFDKTVSTWPLAIAVDAGPMQIQWWEGAVLRSAGDCATESNSRHHVPISWLA